jgi:putative MATE family efflux protein
MSEKADQSFMKTRPVTRLVITMALPMTVSMLINSLYNIVDSYFIAKISEDAMTALSLVYPLQNLIIAITVGFGVGINAVMAYYLGAGRQRMANTAATMGIVMNMLHGLVLMIVCLAVMPSFLKMFTSDGEIIDFGIRYTNIVFLFCIPQAASMSFEKIFQAAGKMSVSMVSLAAGCIINIVLDPLMIFGYGFPKMGIEGAALATGIGQTASLIIYIIVYAVKPKAVKIGFKGMESVGKICRKTYAIGIPASLNLALPSLMISVLNSIFAAFSQVYVLVLGAYYKLQTFLYLTANGIVQGMRPVLSYNFGAGETKRVKEIYKVSLLLIVGVMAVGTLLCLVIPNKLIGLFSNSAEAVQIGTYALRIIAIGFVASSVSVAASGALEALGNGVASLAISLCRYAVIILPAAFLLSKAFGANGVWSAFWITEISTAVIAFFIYKSALSKKLASVSASGANT